MQDIVNHVCTDVTAGKPTVIRKLPAIGGKHIYELMFTTSHHANQFKLPKNYDGIDFKDYGRGESVQQKAVPIYGNIHYIVAQPI